MQSTYTVEVHPAEEGEEGFWVSVPALPGCFSQGNNYEEALENAQEAIQCYLEALIKRGEGVPEEFNYPALVGVRVALPPWYEPVADADSKGACESSFESRVYRRASTGQSPEFVQCSDEAADGGTHAFG